MTPSYAAIAATLELRRWSRRQQDATGRPIEAETVRDRAYRVYRLSGKDLDYAATHGMPPHRNTYAVGVRQ